MVEAQEQGFDSYRVGTEAFVELDKAEWVEQVVSLDMIVQIVLVVDKVALVVDKVALVVGKIEKFDWVEIDIVVFVLVVDKLVLVVER